jgi:hypothetical protein
MAESSIAAQLSQARERLAALESAADIPVPPPLPAVGAVEAVGEVIPSSSDVVSSVPSEGGGWSWWWVAIVILILVGLFCLWYFAPKKNQE